MTEVKITTLCDHLLVSRYIGSDIFQRKNICCVSILSFFMPLYHRRFPYQNLFNILPHFFTCQKQPPSGQFPRRRFPALWQRLAIRQRLCGFGSKSFRLQSYSVGSILRLT